MRIALAAALVSSLGAILIPFLPNRLVQPLRASFSKMSHPHPHASKVSYRQQTASHIRSSLPSYLTESRNVANGLEMAASDHLCSPNLETLLRTRTEGIRAALDKNRIFLEDIARGLEQEDLNVDHSRPISVLLPPPAGISLAEYKFGPYDSPQTLMGHVARDWTAEGYENTNKSYTVVVDMIKEFLPPSGGDADLPSVLIPGAGLSRLGLDLALLGYDVEVNDLSPLMASVSHLFLSRHFDARNQRTIYPHLHRSKNLFHGDSRDQLTPQLAPDPLPSEIVDAHIQSGKPFVSVRISVGGYSELYAGENPAMAAADPDDQGYDDCAKCREARARKLALRAQNGTATTIPVIARFSALVASFFLDKAHSNPLLLLRHTLAPLKPGGLLIVMGPLSWRTDAKPALSWDEVKCWWEENGIEILKERIVAGDYTREEGKMMYTERYVYPIVALRKPL